MALMICPECDREISDKAETCPQCGFPIAKHLVEQKAELIKQEAIETKRIREEQLRVAYQEAQQINMTAAEASNSTDSRSNYKFIFGIIGIISILIILAIYSNNQTVKESERQVAKTKEQDILKRKSGFNTAKTLITTNKLKDEELGSAKVSFDSIDASMAEYNEAQKLLVGVTKRIADVEKVKEAKAAKERKAAEDALYTPGGTRVHARHPNWSPDDCNTIAKGQIYIGMNKDQVAAAWGRPYTVNKTTGSYGVHEQWVMHEMGGSYVYFEDGICTTIQN